MTNDGGSVIRFPFSVRAFRTSLSQEAISNLSEPFMRAKRAQPPDRLLAFRNHKCGHRVQVAVLDWVPLRAQRGGDDGALAQLASRAVGAAHGLDGQRSNAAVGDGAVAREPAADGGAAGVVAVADSCLPSASARAALPAQLLLRLERDAAAVEERIVGVLRDLEEQVGTVLELQRFGFGGALGAAG